MKRRGFTVVELLITITVMGILLTLAVVNLGSAQTNARDSERKGDVESIALHMENYYRNETSDSSGNFFMSGGTYPGWAYISVDSTLKSIMPDLDPKSLRAPDVGENEPKSLVVATNNNQSATGVTPQPSISNDVYVYQPITSSGALCVDPMLGSDCRKFNLYYFSEKDNSVKMITSKNQ